MVLKFNSYSGPTKIALFFMLHISYVPLFFKFHITYSLTLGGIMLLYICHAYLLRKRISEGNLLITGEMLLS